MGNTGNLTLHDLARQLRSRRIDRRRFLHGAAALGASATAISSALRAAPARAQEATEVVFWTSHTEPDLSALQAIVDSFNQQNVGAATPQPRVQVRLVPVPGSETDTTRLTTAIRGGKGPDIYLLDRFIVAQRAAEGVLQELTDFASESGVTADPYVPFAWAEASYNGKLYALPFDTDARALYYNKGLLQEVGVDPAELDPSNGPITFDRLNEIARTIDQKDRDGNYSRMGFVPWFDQGWHYTYGFAFGGVFFDEAACEVSPTDDGVVAGHQYLYDFAKAGGPQEINAFIGNFMLQDFPAETHPFITKRLAFVVTGNWFINNLARYAPDIDYGITYIPVPAGGEQSATWAGGWSVVIPQGAKNPEGAWTFMQYIAGEPGQRMYAEQRQLLPTIQSLLDDPDLFEGPVAFFATDLLPTAKNRPPLPVGSLYWNELTTAWQKVYLNEEEPLPALQTAKDRVQPQLEQYCPIQIS